MKLINLNKTKPYERALKESFGINLNIRSLSRGAAVTKLAEVTQLLQESMTGTSRHRAHKDPTVMKLVLLTQALREHINKLPRARIIFENEEVDRSQVILAAQDMVDTVQGMFEDINDVLVKELPALVDSIQSEIGANESSAFNQAASEALGTLNTTLQETRTALQGALSQLTGQGGPVGSEFDDDAEEGGDDLGDMENDLDDLGDGDKEAPDMPELPDIDDDGAEDMDSGAVGRGKRRLATVPKRGV